MENDQRFALLKQCFAKVIDTSVQSIGPTDIKHTLPEYKDMGASLDGALMKALGPSRGRAEEKFEACCKKYDLEVKLGNINEYSKDNSAGESPVNIEAAARNTQEVEVKLLEELVAQLEKANKSLRSRLTVLEQNINMQVASVAAETHKYETIAGELRPFH